MSRFYTDANAFRNILVKTGIDTISSGADADAAPNQSEMVYWDGNTPSGDFTDLLGEGIYYYDGLNWKKLATGTNTGFITLPIILNQTARTTPNPQITSLTIPDSNYYTISTANYKTGGTIMQGYLVAYLSSASLLNNSILELKDAANNVYATLIGSTSNILTYTLVQSPSFFSMNANTKYKLNLSTNDVIFPIGAGGVELVMLYLKIS